MTKISDAKKLKIRELYRQGLSERAIAKKLKCSRRTVWEHKVFRKK